MSRIGKLPITLPKGVTVKVDGGTVTVQGPKGTDRHRIPSPIGVTVADGVVHCTRSDDSNATRALHGLVRKLIANSVTGVSNGFTRALEIVGVGYRATAQGPDRIEFALGFSHPVRVEAPPGVTFEVPQPTRVIVKGIDKELVGQVAANIRKIRKPEPYKGKGVRYAGEVVLRKAGKAAK